MVLCLILQLATCARQLGRLRYGDRGVPKFIVFMLLAGGRSRLRGLLGMQTQPKNVQNQTVKAM